MTKFTFPLALSAPGKGKIRRLREWMADHAPDIPYSAPPEAPSKSPTITVRFRNKGDAVLVALVLKPGSIP